MIRKRHKEIELNFIAEELLVYSTRHSLLVYSICVCLKVWEYIVQFGTSRIPDCWVFSAINAHTVNESLLVKNTGPFKRLPPHGFLLLKKKSVNRWKENTKTTRLNNIFSLVSN